MSNLCDEFIYWWDGEYEGNCERPLGHSGDHYDGVSWYDDEHEDMTDNHRKIMDVVYVYKKNHSDELKWSVRSVQKNLEHQNIYVVGDDPKIDGVIWVPHKSTLGKYQDQMAKYRLACDIDGLSDEFVAMNDDFFVMESWNPENYVRGYLGTHIAARKRLDTYTRSLIATNNYLSQSGAQNQYSFELHIPFVFRKGPLRSLIDDTAEKYKNVALQVRSLYGNVFDINASVRPDVKNPENFADYPLLSTNERSFANGEIGRYIREKLA